MRKSFYVYPTGKTTKFSHGVGKIIEAEIIGPNAVGGASVETITEGLDVFIAKSFVNTNLKIVSGRSAHFKNHKVTLGRGIKIGTGGSVF